MRHVRLCVGMARFLTSPSFSLNKLSKLPRYSSIYLQMLAFNEQKMRTDLDRYYQIQKEQRDRNSIQAELKRTKEKIIQNLERLSLKKNRDLNSIKSANLESTLKYYVNRGFELMALYYQSLQNLVEGKRQVLHNDQFKFDDGETVKQKQEKAQKLFMKMLGKVGKKEGFKKQ